MSRRARIDIIKDILKNEERANVTELSQKLNVTEVTIRNDLRLLENEGFLKRTHGGAILSSSYTTFSLDDTFNIPLSPEKIAIGNAAAALINPKEWVFIGGGTTCAAIAYALQKVNGVKVITNNLLAIMMLYPNVSATVMITSGQLQQEHMMWDGELFSHFFKNIYVSKAFFGIAAIDFEHGYFVSPSSEINIVSTVSSVSDQCFVVTDSGKFRHQALTCIGGLDTFKNIITDSGIPEEFKEEFHRLGVNVILPKDSVKVVSQIQF